MGGADIIPGVSGGTVALVLGIYRRLVTAISRIDGHLIGLVRKREWREASDYVDLRFLVALGVGILTGIVSLASLMHYLLTEQRSYTLAVFMGLILASSIVVAKMVRPQNGSDALRSCLLATVAAVFAYWLVGGHSQLGEHESALYFFLCGTIAICAMILPGISGAYILWLLGAYETVTDIIKRAPRLDISSTELLSLAVFATGCAVGIISFSKLLRWLLARFHMSTMAVLGGFMIGSLRLMWPFQIDTTPDVTKLKLKQFKPYFPEAWDSEVTICLICGLLALAAVLALEKWGAVTEQPAMEDDLQPPVEPEVT